MSGSHAPQIIQYRDEELRLQVKTLEDEMAELLDKIFDLEMEIKYGGTPGEPEDWRN